MTAPNTPTGPDAEPVATPDRPALPGEEPAEPTAAAQYPAEPGREPRQVVPEIKVGALTGLATALLGVLVGLLWLWLAPRVMYVVSGDQILYVNPEGEERAGADGVLALLGLGAGLLTALAAFLLTRRRGGGIAVAVGLALGGLAGSLIAWRLGVDLGPSTDVLARAKQAGEGKPFSDALKLGAYGVLLVWPMTAMVVVLALSAAFGKREPDRPPYWAGPGWEGPDHPAEQSAEPGPEEQQPPA